MFVVRGLWVVGDGGSVLRHIGVKTRKHRPSLLTKCCTDSTGLERARLVLDILNYPGVWRTSVLAAIYVPFRRWLCVSNTSCCGLKLRH